MLILFGILLLVILIGICKTGNKMNHSCMGYVTFNILCIAAVYWIYKEKNKEHYIVRENVKDISTFLF
jgi:hypothetical protein